MLMILPLAAIVSGENALTIARTDQKLVYVYDSRKRIDVPQYLACLDEARNKEGDWPPICIFSVH
jgi:hypothetical protein